MLIFLRLSNEGALLEAFLKWGRCGARWRGTKRTPKLPGGAGAPPGDTRIPLPGAG